MKTTILISITVLLLACHKSTPTDPEYTATYHAYGKIVPYTVHYYLSATDYDHAQTINTNSFDITITAKKIGNPTLDGFGIAASNIQKTTSINDSLYVSSTIGTEKQEMHAVFKSDYQGHVFATIKK